MRNTDVRVGSGHVSGSRVPKPASNDNQVADEDESSVQGRLAREPGLLALVGPNILERHVGGGCDPIGAKVGLEGRGNEDRAVLGTKQALGCCLCTSPPPPALLGTSHHCCFLRFLY